MAKRKTKKKTASKRRTGYKAVRRIHYPHPSDMEAVVEAGGMSKLDDEQRKAIVARRVVVEPGDWCDDLPENVLKASVGANYVEHVTEDE